ncbi:hypothetical protein U1Q18_049621 [Sarracenia purpurea var. burkii]
MMMKSIVIILIIAVCVQCVLSAENPEKEKKTRRRGRRALTNTPPTSKDLSQQLKAKTRKPAPTIEKPEHVITGEKGVIKVDGKIVCENDEKFKNGDVELEIQGGLIYINWKLTFEARPTFWYVKYNQGKKFKSVTSFVIETFKHDPSGYGTERGLIKYVDNNGGTLTCGL